MSKYISLWQGFSKLNREQRFEKLQHAGLLTAEDVLFLKSGGIQSADLAEHCIERCRSAFLH
jgi:hydroxymethylglutaryl-CoA reductase